MVLNTSATITMIFGRQRINPYFPSRTINISKASLTKQTYLHPLDRLIQSFIKIFIHDSQRMIPIDFIDSLLMVLTVLNLNILLELPKSSCK